MSIKKPVYNIAIAFDLNYLHPFYALITSLLQNNPEANFHIHTIATGLTDLQWEKIEDNTKQYGSDISRYSVDVNEVQNLKLTSNWTQAVYYKLFFPMLVPESVERLLYLDSDTIVIGNISSLFEVNLEGYAVGAVFDNYVKIQPLLNIHDEGEYFNSGVLLIDINKWRELKISEKAVEYLMKYPERILYVDQCALNAVLHNNWKKLPEKYNLIYSFIPDGISKSELTDFIKDKVILHFTLQRPWKMLCKNRLRHLYFYFLKQSPLSSGLFKYSDFSFLKVPQWIGIRLKELYFDSPLLQKIWRSIKA